MERKHLRPGVVVGVPAGAGLSRRDPYLLAVEMWDWPPDSNLAYIRGRLIPTPAQPDDGPHADITLGKRLVHHDPQPSAVLDGVTLALPSPKVLDVDDPGWVEASSGVCGHLKVWRCEDGTRLCLVALHHPRDDGRESMQDVWAALTRMYGTGTVVLERPWPGNNHVDLIERVGGWIRSTTIWPPEQAAAPRAVPLAEWAAHYAVILGLNRMENHLG